MDHDFICLSIYCNKQFSAEQIRALDENATAIEKKMKERADLREAQTQELRKKQAEL